MKSLLAVGVLGAKRPPAIILISRGVALLVDVGGDANREVLPGGRPKRQVGAIDIEAVDGRLPLLPPYW